MPKQCQGSSVWKMEDWSGEGGFIARKRIRCATPRTKCSWLERRSAAKSTRLSFFDVTSIFELPLFRVCFFVVCLVGKLKTLG